MLLNAFRSYFKCPERDECHFGRGIDPQWEAGATNAAIDVEAPIPHFKEAGEIAVLRTHEFSGDEWEVDMAAVCVARQ